MPARRSNSKRLTLSEIEDQVKNSILGSEKPIETIDLSGDDEAKITSGEKENVAQNTNRKKRNAQEDADEESVELDKINVNDVVTDDTCNQVRQKIRRVLDSGEMKVGEFCDAIGVTNRSLNNFLRQSKSMEGAQSNVYSGARAFFKKREIAGVKPQRKKNRGLTKDGKAPVEIDISGIELDGEADDAVAVFDSCDEIRSKINAHLRKPNVTQAQFCRDMVACLHASKARKSIQGKQLADFRNKEGADAGNTSIVFYAAYVFFEKLRIKKGEPKSAHRKEMEKIWPKGFDIQNAHTYITCHVSEMPMIDEYGRLEILRKR